ncbi:hypothetical protein GCM10009087_25930 [Sphingomonas oligophenolica]
MSKSGVERFWGTVRQDNLSIFVGVESPPHTSTVMPDSFRHPSFRIQISVLVCGAMDPGTSPG